MASGLTDENKSSSIEPKKAAVVGSSTAAAPTASGVAPAPAPAPAEDPRDALLVDQLRETLEEVFTVSNLETDKLLRSSMDDQGFIRLSYVLNFPAIKQTLSTLLPPDANPTVQLSLLKRSIEASRHLKFEVEDPAHATLVRYVFSVERKTLIIRELSKNVTKKHIMSLFNDPPHSDNLAKVSSIKLDIGNNWFVNFGSEKECLESFKYLTDNNIKILGETLHVRVKSSASTHPLVGHGHGLQVDPQVSMSRPIISIESQQLGMSDYAQHAQSPILHHTGMTPYGAVAYEQHQYDQMYKTGTTPPPLPETAAMYDNAMAQQVAQQVVQQQQTVVQQQQQQQMAHVQQAAQAAQAAQQAQVAQQMALRQQLIKQQQQAQRGIPSAPRGGGIPGGMGSPPQIATQQQQRQQIIQGQVSPQQMAAQAAQAAQAARAYERQQQVGQHQELPPAQIVSDEFVPEPHEQVPIGPGGPGGRPDVRPPGPVGGPVGPVGPGGPPVGQTRSGHGGIKSHYHRQPRCDYPTDNYLKYNQKDFLDVFKSLQEDNELDIPHSMAGRDRRIVSEEVREPASLLSPADIARELREFRDRNQRRGGGGGGEGRRGGGDRNIRGGNNGQYNGNNNRRRRDIDDIEHRGGHGDDESISDNNDYDDVDDHDNGDDHDHDDNDDNDDGEYSSYENESDDSQYDNRRDRRDEYDDYHDDYHDGYYEGGGGNGRRRGNYDYEYEYNQYEGGQYGYDYENDQYYDGYNNDGYDNNNNYGYRNDGYYDNRNGRNNNNNNRRSGRRGRGQRGVNNNVNNNNNNNNNNKRGRAQKTQKSQRGNNQQKSNQQQQGRRRNNRNGGYYQKKNASKENSTTATNKDINRNISMKNASNNKLYKRKETEEEKQKRKELERQEKERKELERKEKAAAKKNRNNNNQNKGRKQGNKGRFVYKPKQSNKKDNTNIEKEDVKSANITA